MLSNSQLSSITHDETLSVPPQAGALQLVRRYEVWLALVFVALVSWASWYAFAWLVERWQFV